ncbi:MAG: tetratricopeptide repeat protein [Armatimonadetes bacterium]|nr:tetratricopeptide repeat protein [Armatimonadota bacterium]MDW8154003.1 tetratricopeptide repeat protein [Armatimonadota bacterium]
MGVESGFEELLARGERLLEAGELQEAEALLREAVACEPRSARAHSKLGAALARQGRYQEAAAVLHRAIELDPRYAPAYTNLGAVYHEQGRLEEALQAYRKALEVDPEYWIAHQNLAALYRQLGDYGAFVRHMKQATHLMARAQASEGRTGCLPLLLLAALAALGRRAVG